MDEELMLINKTEKVVSLFWWRCCEDCWNDKGFRILNLIDKAVTGFERIDAVGKMLPNSISCYREIIPEIDVATFIVLALKIATTTSTTTLIREFSSVAQLCPTLCDPINHSMPGFPFHHELPEFIQTHVHWVGDAIRPSHPPSSPSPPAPNPSQHQSLFQ